MSMRLFPLLMAFSISACAQIEVKDAEVKNPKDKTLERLELKTLSTKVRRELNAENPDALIAVFNENGVTLFGAPGKEFKVVPEASHRKLMKNSKMGAKKPVNDVIIKTFVNSPLCQGFDDGAGNRIWYPSNCPY